MIKKIKRVIEDLIEKVFKRKELEKYKNSSSVLEKEVKEKAEELEERAGIIALLTSGYCVNLTQDEKRMISNALEFKPFREVIQTPATKAHVRIIWRRLREKIKLNLKEDNETKTT